MKIKKYELYTDKIKNDLKIACVSDIHGRESDGAVQAVREIAPDVILLAGDILEISVDYMQERNECAIAFLEQMAKIAPCYYCFGNHEMFYSHAKGEQPSVSDPELRAGHIARIEALGIHLINDKCEMMGDVLIGGLVCGFDKDPNATRDLDLEFLKNFDARDDYKILLCHYPHVYDKVLKNTDIDLILSGHAHGGQWRIFGRGVYAPHQGLFPKYTSGIHDGRMIINRGASNNVAPIPRFFNPCEVLMINVKKKS